MERVYVLCLECGRLGEVYRYSPDEEPTSVCHVLPAQAPDDPGYVYHHEGGYIILSEDDVWEMANPFDGLESVRRVLKKYIPAPIVDRFDEDYLDSLHEDAGYYIMAEEEVY